MTDQTSRLMNWVERQREAVWHDDLKAQPKPRATLLSAARIAFAVVRDLARGDLNLWAMSLVYTTLLSLVPLLAISFSILKGFGVHNQIEPMLGQLLAPLGDRGIEITQNIIGFVENMKVGVLGSLGFALLFYTVISLMQKIERAFNKAWRVSRERTLGQRFRDYLSVLMIGPVLVFSAMGITATVMSAPVIESMNAFEPIGQTLKIAGRLVPFFMIVAAFTFLYAFIPNTRVKIGPALVGGLIAGVLWNGAGWLFASFVVGSANYTAIYSAFATLIFFMIWLYIGWLILLTGASIAFYVQNPAYAGNAQPTGISHHAREALALAVVALISHNFYRNKTPWTLDGLSSRLNQRSDVIDSVMTALERSGLLKSTADAPATFLPGRPFEEATAGDALRAVRGDGDVSTLGGGEPEGRMTRLLDEAEARANAVLAAISLKELGQAAPAEADSPPVALHDASSGRRGDVSGAG